MDVVQRPALLRRVLIGLISLTVLLLLPVLLFGMSVRPAAAANIEVNGDGDTVSDDNVCILREAIDNANDTTDGDVHDDCAAGDPAGADTITFAANYTITLDGSQLPTITSEITITGNGAASTIIQASTCDPVNLPGSCTPAGWRVFGVGTDGNLTLDGVTVRHGRCAGACATTASDGGGIYNSGGTLTLTNSALSNNIARAGGGIYSYDETEVNVNNSAISGNAASGGYGGGILNAYGSLTVISSAISGNTSDGTSGGIYHEQGTLTVNNSTIDNNTANGEGGGINTGWVTTGTMTNSTISGNTGSQGGGISNDYDSSLTVTNSTFYNNDATSGDGGGIYDGGGVTLVNSLLTANSPTNCYAISSANASNISDDGSCGSATQKTVGEINLDTTLADNGGPTYTHALLAGSHAIDHDFSSSCTGDPVNGVDQRGEPRNVDGYNSASVSECDAGAYEFQGATIVIVKDAIPADNTIFSFTDDIRSPNSFTLLNPNATTKTFNHVAPGGSYTVTETDKPGWPLTALNCSAGAGSTFTENLAGGFAVITNLLDGDTVTCTFSNTLCQPGAYDNGLNTCQDADPGHFVDQQGATDQTECLPGSYQDLEGQDSCKRADAGYYVPGYAAEEQIECPEGTTSEAGAIECTPNHVSACPAIIARTPISNIDYRMTDIVGNGMGDNRRFRAAARIAIPDYVDVVALYGQMAGKGPEWTSNKVRFIYPDGTRVDDFIQNSVAYQLGAIHWYGDELDPAELGNGPNRLKGKMRSRWFLTREGRRMRTPRAVLYYPTYQTDELYADVRALFPTSSLNHVAWETGYTPVQTLTVDIPETQLPVDVMVKLAIVGMDRDPRAISLLVAAGGVSEPLVLTVPTNNPSLNIVEFLLQDVPAGTSQVTIRLESPDVSPDFKHGGDSAAVVGAVVNYACGGPPPTYSLGDFVWYDVNGDGIQQEGGVPFVTTVDLYANATCAGSPLASTTTDTDGKYGFSALPAGDYCVHFRDLPAGVAPTTQDVGDDASDSDADSSGKVMNISLTADDYTIDMGVVTEVCRSADGESIAASEAC